MDSSASLAVGDTFAGRVVKVQKHCKNIAEHCISHFTLHCSFVSQVRLEVGPVDRVAKEDINKFLREMVEESSSPGVVMISIIWLTMMVIVVMMIMVERLQAFSAPVSWAPGPNCPP